MLIRIILCLSLASMTLLCGCANVSTNLPAAIPVLWSSAPLAPKGKRPPKRLRLAHEAATA